ncbi:hypothetical protein F4678DRAFT_301908 [Xylaria arbuscula]|nr:hypothetical protein F4678DRAFT_301908 [Xylaria arbuscula]
MSAIGNVQRRNACDVILNYQGCRLFTAYWPIFLLNSIRKWKRCFFFSGLNTLLLAAGWPLSYCPSLYFMKYNDIESVMTFSPHFPFEDDYPPLHPINELGSEVWRLDRSGSRPNPSRPQDDDNYERESQTNTTLVDSCELVQYDKHVSHSVIDDHRRASPKAKQCDNITIVGHLYDGNTTEMDLLVKMIETLARDSLEKGPLLYSSLRLHLITSIRHAKIKWIKGWLLYLLVDIHGVTH